jgi:poly[ADP-ribose] polymerase 16
MAVCEVLDHPDVKCTLENKAGNGQNSQVGRMRARARNSEGGDVPERYYVVTNNQLLRVKYLLVYAEKHKAESRYETHINIPVPGMSLKLGTHYRHKDHNHKGVMLLMS